MIRSYAIRRMSSKKYGYKLFQNAILFLHNNSKWKFKTESNNNKKEALLYDRMFYKKVKTVTNPKFSVPGVDSILNSATGTPLSATPGANIAAG